MYKFLILVLSLLLSLPADAGFVFLKEHDDGLMYEPGAKDPFTGEQILEGASLPYPLFKHISTFKNGFIISETWFSSVDGLLDRKLIYQGNGVTYRLREEKADYHVYVYDYHKNGNVMHEGLWSHFKDGSGIVGAIGLHKSYFENGKLSSTSFYKGQTVRKLFYYENGNIEREIFNPSQKNHKRNGTYKKYDETGGLIESSEYINGIKVQ